jgi:hypothetical protein
LKKPHWPKRLTTGKRSCPGTSKTGKLYDFSDSAVDLTVTNRIRVEAAPYKTLDTNCSLSDSALFASVSLCGSFFLSSPPGILTGVCPALLSQEMSFTEKKIHSSQMVL